MREIAELQNHFALVQSSFIGATLGCGCGLSSKRERKGSLHTASPDSGLTVFDHVPLLGQELVTKPPTPKTEAERQLMIEAGHLWPVANADWCAYASSHVRNQIS